MKQICKMYQIENLKKQGVIGKELEKHLKEQLKRKPRNQKMQWKKRKQQKRKSNITKSIANVLKRHLLLTSFFEFNRNFFPLEIHGNRHSIWAGLIQGIIEGKTGRLLDNLSYRTVKFLWTVTCTMTAGNILNNKKMKWIVDIVGIVSKI